jgi:hypothetical protein
MVFFTIISFLVSFQKMDPNLGAVIIGAEVTHSGANIIGANFSYVAADVASLMGSAPRSMAPPPRTCHIGCHVGKVGTNDDDVEVGVHFLK